MGQNPGDEKSQPSLELPSFPGLGRRKKRARRSADQAPDPAVTPSAGVDAEETVQLTTTADEHEGVSPPEAGTPAGPPDESPVPAPEPRRKASRARPARRGLSFSVPSLALPGAVAAGLTGLLIGVAGGAATYGALAGCEAVRGVSSCGGGPGFFLLVAILAVLVLLGAGVLKVLGVAAPASTSFLAVGIMTVVVMLTLLDVVYSPWMFVVVPTLGVLSYLLAHWVTTRFDAANPQRPDWT